MSRRDFVIIVTPEFYGYSTETEEDKECTCTELAKIIESIRGVKSAIVDWKGEIDD